MALNLEVKVLFGPQGAEPIAKGNCVAAMRGGEEAGGKSGGRRTEIGYKASAVGQPGHGRGRPILLPSRARVNPAVAPRKCSVLPWEASSALRITGVGCRRRHPMAAEESAEAIVAPDQEGRREGLKSLSQGADQSHSMTAARQQGTGEQLDLFDEVLKATVRHGGPGPGGSGARACAEQQADTAWQRERALTRGYRVERPGKPPWYAIRMPGGVRGGDREEPPYSMIRYLELAKGLQYLANVDRRVRR